MNKKKIAGVIIATSLVLGGIVTSGVIKANAEKDKLADGTEIAAVLHQENPKSVADMDIQEIASNAISKYEDISKKNKKIKVELSNDLVEDYDLVNDKELRKWIIRTKIDSSMAGVELSDQGILNDSVKSMKKRNLAFKFAKENYNVKVNTADVKKYILEEMEFYENDPNMGPFFTKLTSGLGIEKKEFYLEWEYDNFLNNFMWLQLRQKFEEKYPADLNENQMDYTNKLIKAYNNELNAFIDAKGKVKSVKWD